MNLTQRKWTCVFSFAAYIKIVIKKQRNTQQHNNTLSSLAVSVVSISSACFSSGFPENTPRGAHSKYSGTCLNCKHTQKERSTRSKSTLPISEWYSECKVDIRHLQKISDDEFRNNFYSNSTIISENCNNLQKVPLHSITLNQQEVNFTQKQRFR